MEAKAKMTEPISKSVLDQISAFCEQRSAGYSTVKMLLEEITRLKRGDLTPQELQDLCHGLSEEDCGRFCTGCLKYQVKMFGREKVVEDLRTRLVSAAKYLLKNEPLVGTSREEYLGMIAGRVVWEARWEGEDKSANDLPPSP